MYAAAPAEPAPQRLATFERPGWQRSIERSTSMDIRVKEFARELFAYIHVFQSWQPTTRWHIGPGLEVGVFGAISWALLLFYKAVEDETVLLTHIYREFKHMLDAKRRLASAPEAEAGDKPPEPEWTLDERLMLHATMLIETYKPEVRAAKCKPQPLKVLKATCPAPIGHLPIIRDRPGDEKNIYGIIADHFDRELTASTSYWYYNAMELLVSRHARSEAKELGKAAQLASTFDNLVVLAAYHLLHVSSDDAWLHAAVEGRVMVSEMTSQQKIAAFIAKMISNNRAAAAAEAWRP